MREKDPEWLFDESVQVGVDYTDADLVADYDSQHEGFRDFAQEARRIVAALKLSAHSTVLDIGCGTGGLATHFAQLCRYVYAVDVSEAMLARLGKKIEQQGITNIYPIRAGFLSYEHEGEGLDAIVANINLHHLPDFWKQIALCRFYDLLQSGGRLFLADVVFHFEPRDYHREISSWLKSMKEQAGRQMADETVVHIREEYSTWGWVLTGMLERAGFCIEDECEIMPQIRAYVCRK